MKTRLIADFIGKQMTLLLSKEIGEMDPVACATTYSPATDEVWVGFQRLSTGHTVVYTIPAESLEMPLDAFSEKYLSPWVNKLLTEQEFLERGS